MKKLLLLITLVAGVIAFALPGQATTLEFSLDTSFPGSDKPDPDGTGPWLNALFDDENIAGSVLLTLSATLTDPDPGDPNKVGLWYFNLDEEIKPNSLSFEVQGSPTAPEATIKTGNKKADGDGWYDIEFAFPTSASNPFDNSDSITYLITSDDDILATSFNFPSVPNPGGVSGEDLWYTAAHIQSILTAPYSTWIGDGNGGDVGNGPVPGGDPIPEPATMLLLGSGLIGFAVSGRKKLKKRNG